MDLRRQASIPPRRIGLLLAGTLLAAVAAFVVAGALPKAYEATATIIVGSSPSPASAGAAAQVTSQRLSQTYADLATTGPILQKVIDKLQLGTSTDELRGRIRADAPSDSTILRVAARDADPNRAAAIANGIATELVASAAIPARAPETQKFIDEQLSQMQTQIQTTQAEVARLSALPARSASQEQDLQLAQSRLVTLQSTYASLLASSGASANPLSVVEAAAAPLQPLSPQRLLIALVVAALALLLGIVLAFLIGRLGDTMKSADRIETELGLPTLGGITRMEGDPRQSEIYHLVTLVDPASPVAEAYRALRTNTELAMVGAPARTLLVTSSVPGEGRTTTAGNLAVAFAQAGRRTLLLDADLRKPGVHKLFDLPNAYGLFTLLRSEDASYEQLVHTTEQDRLSVMTSGPLPPNPAELLRSERFRGILQRLSVAHDLVVIDSPPLEGVADAAVLASVTDATLLVVDTGHTRPDAAARGREALAQVEARVLGAVMNKLSKAEPNEHPSKSSRAQGLDKEGVAVAASSGPVVAASGSERR